MISDTQNSLPFTSNENDDNDKHKNCGQNDGGYNTWTFSVCMSMGRCNYNYCT